MKLITYFAVSDDAGVILSVWARLSSAQEAARVAARTGPCATYVHTIGVDIDVTVAPMPGQTISMKGKLDRFTSAYATEGVKGHLRGCAAFVGDESAACDCQKRAEDLEEIARLNRREVEIKAADAIDRRFNEALTDLATGKETKR